jgi:hypothetical protein
MLVLASPPELRVKIYEKILADVLNPTKRALLKPCSGCVLCCKQVNEEFENDWERSKSKFWHAEAKLIWEYFT